MVKCKDGGHVLPRSTTCRSDYEPLQTEKVKSVRPPSHYYRVAPINEIGLLIARTGKKPCKPLVENTSLMSL